MNWNKASRLLSLIQVFNEMGFVAKRTDSLATIRARLMKSYSMWYIYRVNQIQVASMPKPDFSQGISN